MPYFDAELNIPTVFIIGEFEAVGGVRQILTEYTQGVASTVYYDIPVYYALSDVVSGTKDVQNEFYIATSGTLGDVSLNEEVEFFVSTTGTLGDDVRNITNDFIVGAVPSGVYGGLTIDIEYIQGHIVSPVGTGEDVDVEWVMPSTYATQIDQDVDWEIATSNLQSGHWPYPKESYLYFTDVLASTFPAPFSYLYFQKIVIDGTKIEDDLTDFPVAIRINDSSNEIFVKTQNDGSDIKFKHNNTWLKHELVNFNKTNHELLAYVKCNLITNTDFTFYIVYGDNTNLEDPVNTWSSNYEIVYHFQQAPSSDTLNSAQDGTNDALPKNMEVGDLVDSFLGAKVLRFDGVNEYLSVRDLNYNTPGELPEVTVEAIIKTTYSTSVRKIIASWDRSAVFRFTIGDDLPSNYYGLVGWDTCDETDTIHDMQSNSRVDNNTFRYVAVTYTSNGGTKRIFVDGNLDKEQIGAHTNGYGLVEGTTETPRYGFIGVGSEASGFDGTTGPNYYFVGDMAEFRLTYAARSSGWIKTTYNNLMDFDNFFKENGGTEYRYFISGGIGINDQINSEMATVNSGTGEGGYLWPLPSDVYSTASGARHPTEFDIYVSLCNTVPSGQVYKLPDGVWPVASGYYFGGEVTTSGLLIGYDQDIYVSLESLISGSNQNTYRADIRLHALEIDNFFLEVDEYTTAAGIMSVDVYDKRRIPISTSGTYFVISGTRVPVTFSGIEVPTTDLGQPIVASGYRMFFDSPTDFFAEEAIEIMAHGENIIGDVLERTYYLLYGYNLIYDTPPEVIWGWGNQIIVWATAKNKASCPASSTDAWWFEIRPKEHADLGATIVPTGYANLPATIYPQLQPKTFFYGAKVTVIVRAKDEAGNEMEPFVLDFTIEDNPN